jgi:hypothetical protein
MRLALAILRAADRDAKAAGARMIALHLSTKSTSKTDPIVGQVDDDFPTIDTHGHLRKELKKAGAPLIRREGSHYTRQACAIVGEYVADELRRMAN